VAPIFCVSANLLIMKTIIAVLCSLFLFALPAELYAQNDPSTGQKVKTGVKKGYKGAKKGVKKGAHEVAEQSSEMKSELTDKEVEHKMGPAGQDIFISDDGRYYYKDGKGHRVYLTDAQLRDKPAKPDDD
jgi:hypothetical protein